MIFLKVKYFWVCNTHSFLHIHFAVKILGEEERNCRKRGVGAHGSWGDPKCQVPLPVLLPVGRAASFYRIKLKGPPGKA